MKLDPERDSAIEVLHEGRWLPGTLLHRYRRREDGRWRGIVRYTAGVGEQYEQSRDQDEIRAAAATQPPAGEPSGGRPATSSGR